MVVPATYNSLLKDTSPPTERLSLMDASVIVKPSTDKLPPIDKSPTIFTPLLKDTSPSTRRPAFKEASPATVIVDES